MIPPLPQSTLDANPRFAQLWERTTTQLLDLDGSSRREAALRNSFTTLPPPLPPAEATDTSKAKAKAKPDFGAEITQLRVRAMRRAILRRMFASEPTELVALVAAATTADGRRDQNVLGDEMVEFRATGLDGLAGQVGRQLASVHAALVDVVVSGGGAGTTVPTYVEAQMARVARAQRDVVGRLERLGQVRAELAELQARTLQGEIRGLEARKHGARARHGAARAAFLGGVAGAMALKVRVLVLEARREEARGQDAEERRRVARRMMGEAGTEEMRLVERRRELRGVLGEYEAVDPGGRVMGLLGTRYAELETEAARVREDIARLGGR